MRKLGLSLFILADLAVLSASAMFLAIRLGVAKVPAGLPTNLFPAQMLASVSPRVNTSTNFSANPVTPTPTPSAGAETATAKPAGANGSRNILFTYRNSLPKKVMIRADFTGWRAEPMEKDPATKIWKYSVPLEPGEYSYLFSVDDKPVRDPANKRTKKVGTTVVSSLVVGPLSTASH